MQSVLGNAASGAVTSIIAGTGISVDAATGDVTVTNTGSGAALVVSDQGTGATLTCPFDNTYFVNLCHQINTAATGTYTIANPTTTTCTQGQRLELRIKSTNAQTYSFGSEFRGGTDLPLAGLTHAGGSTTDYLGFICNETDTKWDFVAIARGY
jgi:hypothetical protein